MKKLSNFTLVMGFIGFLLSINTFNSNPTFATSLTLFIFIAFVVIGGYGGLECEE